MIDITAVWRNGFARLALTQKDEVRPLAPLLSGKCPVGEIRLG